MKTMNKFLKGLCIAGSLVFGITAPADAQMGGQLTAFNKTTLQMRPDALKVRAPEFYHPYIYKQAGAVVRILPKDHYSFVWNTYPYYYHDGLFYQSYADDSYKIAIPPIGAEVPSLPIGADIISIDGNPYFQYKGIYYDSVIRPDGQFAYKVVGINGIVNTDADPDPALPLVGDLTDRLPDGSRQVKLGRKIYWVTPGDIYLEEVEGDKNKSYRVVWVSERKKQEPVPAMENKG
jgi:hypothetical protein